MVFITSIGETLIWKAKDVSDQRSKTENVVQPIKSIMNEAELNKININCYVSDSAGEYACSKESIYLILEAIKEILFELIIDLIF